MPHTLSQVCEILQRYAMQPTLAGDGQRSIAGVATLDEAGDEQISFLSNPKYEKLLAATRAAAVVCKPEIAAPAHLNVVRVPDPYAAITVLIAELHGYRKHPRPSAASGAAHIAPSATVGENANIHPGATIDEHAAIGRNATIYPGVYVGPRCRVGDDAILYPNVVLYDDTILGNRVTIHAGTVVGNDGLGYAPIGGKWVKIPQIGIVEIGDDVEIGSNCSIDRATLGRTRIGSGTKMSNLIAIGHGTHVGEHCMFVAQVGLAGSVDVGNRVTMAGQAGVVGHIRIGDSATVGAKAGVTSSVADGETVLGAPAIPVREMRRQVACLMRLPDTTEAVKLLEKRIAELERRLNGSPGLAP